MGFKVQNDLASLSSLKQLRQNQEQMGQLVDRLSNGQRINDASDDAAGAAASMRLNASIGGLTAAAKNIMEAGSTIQIADGGMLQTEQMLIRMKELATQAANSTSQVARSAIENEMFALQAEIDRVAQSTTYNGQSVLDGNFRQAFQIGDADNSASRLEIGIGGVSSASLNGGAQLTLDVSSAGQAQNTLDRIDNALDYLAGQRAELGSIRNRLDYQASNLSVNIENKIAAESTISDADMAQEISEFTKVQILLQADTAVLAQANAASQFPTGVLKG